jgi:tetratricopeptide (TPR) repeat protein
MEFAILGPTALYVDGHPVPLGAAKQRALLGLLLYHVRQSVRVDTIIEYLWDRQPGDHRENLYALASRNRAVLNSVGLRDALVRLNSVRAYRLELDPELIDLYRFRRLVATARTAGQERRYEVAAELLTEAIGLWREEPLAELRGARAEQLRRHLADSFLDAHKLLTESQLSMGEHEPVLARLEPLLHTYDIDETLAQQWIRALCAAGREEQARAFSAAFRRRFRKEMRTEPAVEVPLAVPGLGGLPAVRAPAATAPRLLPHDINDFTGHADLLTELDRLASPEGAGASVMVISGMPGVGKTTLAIHWGHRQRHRFPDGQLYLNANAYGPNPPEEPAEILGRLLRALDVPPSRIPTGVDQRRDRLNQVLAGKRVLLLLDNVRDSTQARMLLPASDTCVTVLTSRNRLTGLTIRDAVRVMTVPPLPERECMALLGQVIGADRAAAEPDALQALVRLCGGIPLVLRIVGEHVAERPRASLADLVEDLNTHLLDCAGEDGEEADLRTIFAWSYRALRPDVARLFRLLGLHPGASIGPEAAAALCGTLVQQTEQQLNTLAKAHLVNHDTARRYQFHDLLRRFALDRAELDEPAGERTEAVRRLLDWYLLSAANAVAVLAPEQDPVPDLPRPELVTPLTFTADNDAMKWCEAERGNLCAVARWATRHGFWRHGWQIPAVIREVYDRYGRQDDLLELHELALSAARAEGHRVGQIGTLGNLGSIYFTLHDYRRAIASFEEAIPLAREIGYLEGEVACAHNLASVYLRIGQVVRAIRIFNEALATSRRLGNSLGEAATLHRLGDAFRQLHRYDRAAGYYLESLAIWEQIGSLRGQGATHGELAALYLQAGQPERALEHTRRALEIHARTKDEAAHCDTLITLADVEYALARYPEAVADGRRALAISEEIGDPRRRAWALTVLADTLVAAGDLSGARRLCAQALRLLDEVADPQADALRDRLHAVSRSALPPAASA